MKEGEINFMLRSKKYLKFSHVLVVLGNLLSYYRKEYCIWFILNTSNKMEDLGKD